MEKPAKKISRKPKREKPAKKISRKPKREKPAKRRAKKPKMEKPWYEYPQFKEEAKRQGLWGKKGW